VRILGIDPGYATIGYGVIDYNKNRFSVAGYGAVTTPAGIPFERRLSDIYNDMNELIKKYGPDEMSIEKLYFNTNTTTAIDVAEARGVILLAAYGGGVKIAEYTPLQVKQSVVGYGRAEKQQVMAMTASILGLGKIKLDDTADALALAVCHAHCGTSRIQAFYNGKKTRLV